MSASIVATPPPVVWAQRNDVLFVTFNVESKDPEFKLTEDTLFFKAVGLPEKKNYEVTINFFSKINQEKVESKNCGRCFEFVIAKADTKGSYWPSLTTDKKKPHWLKVDFNKWKDEDELDEEEGMGGFNDLMASMGGMGGGGDGKPSFDDIEHEDSDDEELPSLE
ncbi:unnamed protein product [Diamesa serratosioi]